MVKVMVADDSSYVRKHVARVLIDAGFDVVEAKDGEEALTLAEQMPEIAVMICDVNMPKRSGLEVLKALSLSKTRSDLPVLMLTTESQVEMLQRARALGAKGWIVKPFKADSLIQSVKKLSAAKAA